VIRLKHYSFRTEKTYYEWIRRYLAYCAKTGKKYRSPHSVKSFLTALAVKDEVAASTQNQAFNAILFLFREVLEIQLDGIAGAVRAKAKRRLPVVLTPDEVRRALEGVSGTRRLMLELIYGTGLRVSELTRLRVMDLDFDGGVLRVHDGKGGKDRAVPLPKRLDEPLKKHLERVRELHDQDLSIGLGEVYIPPALARKYPGAGKEWKWQYVFPASRLSVDPRSGLTRRHHVLDKSVQDAMRAAVKAAGIPKRATVHTLRHSFATHLLMGGVNIREVQDLLGHKNLETTMIYTHVLRDISNAPASPLDSLWED
jgi:integron integrase